MVTAMTTAATILVICFIWGIVALAAGLTAVALVRDNQAILFSLLTAGLIVIAGAATWRLWSVRKLSAD